MPETTGPVILTQDHAEMLARFLATRPESSLLLLSNVLSAGLEDGGGPFQGTYAAYLENGEIAGVAAHYRNGMVVLLAPENAPGLLRAAAAASGRGVSGIAGPYDQVRQALPDVLRTGRRPAMDGREVLYSLHLDALAVPDLLLGGDVTCRRPLDDEIPVLVEVRVAFMREHLGPQMRASHENEAREAVGRQQRANDLRVLETAGEVVATAAITAGIPGMVQVGSVYTRPEHRCRGYGRAVVAGLLLEARARGTRQAILFTGTEMPAARRAYTALGFRPIGEYGLVLF
ncbi:MAG TPA: GNAT family N-acetyltransferase [Methanoregulaceae archaeon]|nr:GNAT family N-acetyltransferase [Methanoregulaceae archaeon]